ncbi:MAG TPA: hydrolase 2, exosortase A system-associated [Rhodocyclaceae bacterium]|nr:hydrolase 2, exosortase A system-associated [Rhodocyclaceae bacterium]
MATEAFYLPAAGGQRFCLFHQPEAVGREKGNLLFVHPFAEEMNKSRRMAALQARALAAAGYGVLLMDLAGCGDSTGSLDHTAWEDWVADAAMGGRWLRQRSEAPLWLWGLRTGCLVAAAAARRLDEAVNFLFWQPTVSGKVHLQQFLRLKVAGALADGGPKGVTQMLRHRLAAGEEIEVAGYVFSASLANGLEAAELAPPDRPGRVEWLELSAQAEASLAPVSQKTLAAWMAAGHDARGRVVAGQQFWQTVETTECPALLAATLECLQEESA